MERKNYYQTWLDEGYAIVDMPWGLSSESVAEIEEWFALILRGIRRRATTSPQPPTEPATPGE